jgi:hypothetical protein
MSNASPMSSPLVGHLKLSSKQSPTSEKQRAEGVGWSFLCGDQPRCATKQRGSNPMF